MPVHLLYQLAITIKPAFALLKKWNPIYNNKNFNHDDLGVNNAVHTFVRVSLPLKLLCRMTYGKGLYLSISRCRITGQPSHATFTQDSLTRRLDFVKCSSLKSAGVRAVVRVYMYIYIYIFYAAMITETDDDSFQLRRPFPSVIRDCGEKVHDTHAVPAGD